jgi:hypothetical protein
MVMVGDSDQRQSSPTRRFDQPRWAYPPVAEVGMHMQVGATARAGRFAAMLAGHTVSLIEAPVPHLSSRLVHPEFNEV